MQNRLKKAAAFHIIDAGGGAMILGITGGSGCGKTTALRLCGTWAAWCWTATPFITIS